MAMRPAVRDALVLVAVFAVLLGGLYAYTGSWPPAVIVESGSMMHKECGRDDPPTSCDPDVKYGRFGTIDPGDLVLVKDVKTIDDVVTLVEGGRERYGMSGDVIVYYPSNDRARTPIIHRAVAYVEVEGTKGSADYYVRWDPNAPCEGGADKVERKDRTWCHYGSNGVVIPSIPVNGGQFGGDSGYLPLRSGFITKGDNPATNRAIDQQSGLYQEPVPVQLEWIEGKGRAELPWLGLIKLALAKTPNERFPPASWKHVCVPLISCTGVVPGIPGGAYAPQDLWVMLGITLFLLVGVPLVYDGYKAYKHKQAEKALPPSPGALDAQPTPAGTIGLSWPAVPGTIHAYRVYRNDTRIASVTSTYYEDKDVKSGESYAYSVSAVSEHGNEGPRSIVVSAEPAAAETPSS